VGVRQHEVTPREGERRAGGEPLDAELRRNQQSTPPTTAPMPKKPSSRP
jgi:hypothetical protein